MNNNTPTHHRFVSVHRRQIRRSIRTSLKARPLTNKLMLTVFHLFQVKFQTLDLDLLLFKFFQSFYF